MQKKPRIGNADLGKALARALRGPIPSGGEVPVEPEAGGEVDVSAVEAEVGDYDSNVKELNEVRAALAALTKQLLEVQSREDLDRLKVLRSVLADREAQARNALKVLHAARLRHGNERDVVRVEIWEFGQGPVVEGEL